MYLFCSRDYHSSNQIPLVQSENSPTYLRDSKGTSEEIEAGSFAYLLPQVTPSTSMLRGLQERYMALQTPR
jgi:hypothetical protein